MYIFLSPNSRVIDSSPTMKYGFVVVEDYLVQALENPITEYKYVEGNFVHFPRPSMNHVILDGEWILHEELHKLTLGRLTLINAIKVVRDERKSGGVNVYGNWFHSDDSSRVQHLGLLTLGANIPSNLQWKTMQGTFVIMTQQLVNGIFSSILLHDMNTFAMAELHIACMLECYDPFKYDYRVGWPPIFG
jgi:hypothetical protein